MPRAHDCLQHLAYRQCESVETHGLECGPYEHWHEEWWECRVCGEKFTARDLEASLRDTPFMNGGS
jgi:hypothetical protein